MTIRFIKQFSALCCVEAIVADDPDLAATFIQQGIAIPVRDDERYEISERIDDVESNRLELRATERG